MSAVQFSADWFSSWQPVQKSSWLVRHGGPSIAHTRTHTRASRLWLLRKVKYKNSRCEFWCFNKKKSVLVPVSLSLVSALERAFTQPTTLARADKVLVPTARPSRSPFMPFCFFFSEMNSFFGLLSSQLPCSRCSCRRCLLPPRGDTQGGKRRGGESGGEKIK